MTRDTDLIRRGDAISWCDKWIATFGAVEIRHTSAREYALDAVKDLRDALHSIPAHPSQEPPSPGVTAGATGMPPSIWAWYVHPNMQNEHMEGGWTETQDKRETLYIRADLATPAPVVPADQRAAIEALADRMWRVHPKDIHAAGYEHLERGGKYENPRAAWYADQIEALFKQFRDQVSPVEPAEGLDPERLVMAWMSEMEGFATRGERFMDTITDGNDVAPWLHAACQVGIDAALRSAPPVGARVIAEKAYLAGFNAAGEGYNGEWPFHDKGISPDTDEGWLIGRDMALAALLPAGEGEE